MWYGPVSFVIGAYLGCIILHVILPAFKVTGYCCDNKTLQPLVYRLNGFGVLLASSGLFYILPDDWKVILFNEKAVAFTVANIVGVLSSTFLYLRGGTEKYARCVTVDQLPSSATIVLELQSSSS